MDIRPFNLTRVPRARTDICKCIGDRLRRARELRGISQKILGCHLGISFQQIQKYESGRNRIGSDSLYAISKFLGVSLDYFFCGIEYEKKKTIYDGEKELFSCFMRILNNQPKEKQRIVKFIKNAIDCLENS